MQKFLLELTQIVYFEGVRFFLVEPKSCFHAGDFVARRGPAQIESVALCVWQCHLRNVSTLSNRTHFEGLVLKTPPLLRGLCYNLSVSSERIDLFQTHLPTRGGPIRCGFGRDRMTYAILRIWLPLKTAKTFKQAEYVGCAACVQATHVACLSFVFVCRALGGASMETWI